MGAVCGGGRRESCPGLNDLGGPGQVRSGHIAREMGQPRSGAFDELHGERIRLDGKASRNNPVRVPARLGARRCQGRLDFPLPSIRRPARALPWSIKVCGRGGENGLMRYWHWADRVQVLLTASVGRASQGWLGLFIAPVAGTTFLALAKLINQPAPGFGKRFC